MDVKTVRRKRLEQLLELAQAYKGCSRKELARILGRDRTKLVPASGVPKLDMVIDLCRVLEFSKVRGTREAHHSAHRIR